MTKLNFSIKNQVFSFLESYSFLLFLKNKYVGLALFILSLVNPTGALFSLLAYYSGGLFLKLLGASFSRDNSFYSYNSILVGLLAGFLFEFSIYSMIFVIVLSFLTASLSFFLSSIFAKYFSLPILNLPFTICGIAVFLLLAQYGNLNLAHTPLQFHLNLDFLPFWLSGFFKALGAIIFLPYDIVGIIVLLIVLAFSRISFFMSVLGYFTGTIFLTLLKGSAHPVNADIYNFNFILIAIALGAYLMIPTFKSYIIAILAVLMSVIIMDTANAIWAIYQVPVFTLPFIVIVSVVLYIAKNLNFKYVTQVFLETPEKNLLHYINYTNRFDDLIAKPYLPFSGEWHVYQGHDDHWTHKGVWKHAYDFIIKDPISKKSYLNDGLNVRDYLCFGKPILSPINGTVVALYDKFIDNEIGEVDYENNWGNYVIIQSDFGYFVELSHLQQDSLAVNLYDRVYVNQKIANCGNSGYSPEPHLHIQCQQFGFLGANTVDFTFGNALLNKKQVLQKQKVHIGDSLKVRFSTNTNKLFQFILDDSFKYTVRKNNKALLAGEIVVKMDEYGFNYLYDMEKNVALYYRNSEDFFAFTTLIGSNESVLAYIFAALPSIYLSNKESHWEDQVNPVFIEKENWFISFFRSFFHDSFKYLTNVKYLPQQKTITTTTKLFTPLKKRKIFEANIKLSANNQWIEQIIIHKNGDSWEINIDEN